MNKRFLTCLFALLLAVMSQSPCAAAAVLTTRIHGGTDRGDLILSCDPTWSALDYTAETASGVSLTDPYAIERGADKGLVHLMNQGGQPVTQYSIPRQTIRAVVKTKYSDDETERVDLVFTKDALILIDTAPTNGGIFTVSEVYRLLLLADGNVDRSLVKNKPDLKPILAAGLSFYRSAKGACGGDVKGTGP